ncbi:MAG: tRNA dihydrouridine synthase DusB [Phascolarctobacterium sp.]|nr:tRNA dihydrouridine synthase DusB [Phascolarctobacterium sp.]
MNIHFAPLQGYTDDVYRRLHHELIGGITTYTTPFLRVEGGGVRSKDLRDIRPEHNEGVPVVPQIILKSMKEFDYLLGVVEEKGYTRIDLNMGCPVPKIVNNGEGSALMKNPQLAYEILAAMVDAVRIPVTVKFRAGWDDDNRNAVEIALAAERAGVAAVAVHGRTRVQFYEGKADWNIIRDVKQAVKIPVFGNGDIFSAADGVRMLEETGCDGLMVGRGADGNPWLFTQLKAVLEGKEVPAAPGVDERLDLAAEHLQMLIDYKGEYISVKEMRRHISAYLKGLPHAAEFRSRFHKMDTQVQFMELLDEYRTCAHAYYEAYPKQLGAQS